MARQYDFGKNQILRAEFLNALQDVLSSYLDMVVLSYSGQNVLANATTDNPISITIDGRMRSIPETISGTPAGAAGTYDVFIVARLSSFTLEPILSGDVPSVVAGEVYRKVGTCEWDGSAVTGVHTFATRVNAALLQGRGVSTLSAPYLIPVTGENGRLDKSWFNAEYVPEDPVGSVREVWVPTSSVFSVPPNWVVMQGQVLGPTEHSFDGVGTITLPDMRNKAVCGANPATVYGSAGLPSTMSSAAPGINGLTGDNAPRNLSHTHTVRPHRHTRYAHEHVASHRHYVPGHQHLVPQRQVRHVTAPNTVTEQRAYSGYTDACDDEYTTYASRTTTHANTSGPVSYSPTQIANSALGEVDVRPGHVGLVYMLKVH